jgi:hypothetical protein
MRSSMTSRETCGHSHGRTGGNAVKTAIEDSAPDTREKEGWFRRLPPDAQQDFRRRWREEERRDEHLRERRRATEVRYLVEGVMLFALLEFFFFGLSAGRLLLLFVPGLAFGWICARLRAGRMKYMIAGAVAYFAVYGLFGLFAIWHFIVFVGLAGALGAVHELQRCDGSELS